MTKKLGVPELRRKISLIDSRQRFLEGRLTNPRLSQPARDAHLRELRYIPPKLGKLNKKLELALVETKQARRERANLKRREKRL
jgi:hypothetical protein